jgi:hypothetical protein
VQKAEIKIAGKKVEVPSATIGNQTVIVTGKWLRTASVKDETWLETEAVSDPPAFIAELAKTPLRPDLLTFAQRLPNVTPKWNYPMQWDNVAAIPLAEGFRNWWENRLPQEARKNARRAANRGVTTRIVQLSDDVVRGIMEINNETAVVQGKPSRHYGKDFETVKRDYSSFPDRSEYIAAYCGEEFVGLVWLVRLGQVITLSQLSTKIKHYDKRPANALMARAVESCCERGYQYLTYGKYLYGKNTESSLMEFKRRLGFEQILVPRYYVPLAAKGRLALRLHLHLGARNVLPQGLILLLIKLRAKYYETRYRQRAKPQPALSPENSTT